MTDANLTADARPADDRGRRALELVEEALRGLQYGVVTIIVQDGVVVQVERTERRRVQSPRRRT